MIDGVSRVSRGRTADIHGSGCAEGGLFSVQSPEPPEAGRHLWPDL